MSNITSLAVDLAKNTFQLHGTDSKGKVILKKKINRDKLPKEEQPFKNGWSPSH